MCVIADNITWLVVRQMLRCINYDGVPQNISALGRAVLTNGHVPRAPGFFFLFEGPQLAAVKCFLKSNYLIVAINETV